MANLDGEFLEENKYRSYPFVEEDPVFLAPEDSYDTNSFYLDAYLQAPVSNLDLIVPGEVYQLYSHTHLSAAVQLITSVSGTVISLVGGNYEIFEDYEIQWYSVATAQRTLTLILILSSIHPLWDISATLSPRTASGGYLSFVPRAAEQRPERVDELEIEPGSVDWATSGETAQMLEGYNLQLQINPGTPRIANLEHQDTAVKRITRVVLNAVPGYGLGRRPVDCSPSSGIYTINGIRPVNGNFMLFGGPCYRVSRPDGVIAGDEFEAADNALTINNDCRACCDCIDFVALLEDIRTLKDEGLAIKAIWADVREAYKEVRAAWLEKIDCLGTGCFSNSFAYAFTGWLITVQVHVGNPQNCMKDGASLSTVFSGGDYDPLYVPGTGMLYRDSREQYMQVDPIQVGSAFTMEDNSGISSGGYRMFAFSVRMRPSVDRVDGNTVVVNTELTACGDDSVSLSNTTTLLGNIAKS